MAETVTAKELAEIEVWLHRVQHLWSRQRLHGYSDGLLIVDCWCVPIYEIPEWADEAAEREDPPSTWCPILSPHLLDAEPDVI